MYFYGTHGRCAHGGGRSTDPKSSCVHLSCIWAAWCLRATCPTFLPSASAAGAAATLRLRASAWRAPGNACCGGASCVCCPGRSVDYPESSPVRPCNSAPLCQAQAEAQARRARGKQQHSLLYIICTGLTWRPTLSVSHAAVSSSLSRPRWCRVLADRSLVSVSRLSRAPSGLAFRSLSRYLSIVHGVVSCLVVLALAHAW